VDTRSAAGVRNNPTRGQRFWRPELRAVGVASSIGHWPDRRPRRHPTDGVCASIPLGDPGRSASGRDRCGCKPRTRPRASSSRSEATRVRPSTAAVPAASRNLEVANLGAPR